MDALQQTLPPADSYYLPHAKVYPREVSGRFARLRTLAVWLLLGIYYLLPWLNLHGRQAVLFNLRDASSTSSTWCCGRRTSSS